MWLYKLLVNILVVICKILGVKVKGKENLLIDGAVVMIANHTHWMDPVYMAIAYRKRQIHFMGKGEFFENKILGKLFNYIGTFAIHRGQSDFTSLKQALGVLRKQEVLGIFPEGTRNKTEQPLLEFKEGAVLIAFKGKAAILPSGIKNSKNIFAVWRPRPVITIGEPIYIDITEDGENKKPTTNEIVNKYLAISSNSVEELIKN